MRIGTFNVHGWHDATQRKRVEDAIAFLRAADCDVLVLNEVTSDEGPLPRVARALGMHATFGWAGHGGNAVLTRAAPREVAVVMLDAAPGKLRSAVVTRVGLRSAAPAVDTDTDIDIDIVGLHLDHMREDDRVLQLAQLAEALVGRPDHILAGDFNAMRLADLDEEARARMQRARAQEGWEPGRDDVVRRLDAWGYVDAVRRALAPSDAAYREGLAHPIADAHAVTSRVGTRIDYVYMAPSVAARACVSGARTVATDVSDHGLVVVEVGPRVGNAVWHPVGVRRP